MSDIQECPALLVEFTTAMRGDWTHDETWQAITACKTAGFEWARIARGLVDLALRDEAVPTRPRDLWAAVRGLRSLPGTGTLPETGGQGGAEYLAAKAAITARTGMTGPQAVLRETGELELLREGHDP
jgi:hypothetical protein